jgi:hypothetical protein
MSGDSPGEFASQGMAPSAVCQAFAQGRALRKTLRMDAWIGLVGALAGATIAWAAQYVTRRSEIRERQDTLLLEQCAIVVALSEDYRNRVWEERSKVAAGVVAAWDIGAYRLAQARLRILCREAGMLAALENLGKAGTGLGRAWRLSPQDNGSVQAARETHRSVLNAFIDISSKLLRSD